MSYLTHNPALGVKIRTPRSKELRCFTPQEARQFLAAAQSARYHPLWYAALTTGMRRGELLGLRWEDVDFERQTIAVRRSVGQVPGGLEENPPKNNKARTVGMDDTLTAYLREAKAQQDEWYSRHVPVS